MYSSDRISELLDEKKRPFLDQLMSFLRISSVSTSSRHRSDINDCADFLVAEFQNIGLGNVKSYSTPGYHHIRAHRNNHTLSYDLFGHRQ